MNYVAGVLDQMRMQRKRVVEVKPEVVQEYYRWLWADMEKRVWPKGCSSWYQNASGRIPILWPSTTYRYWWATRSPSLAQYNTA